MIASRVSYFLKLKGPSFIIDTACSSSLYAVEHAYNAINKGEIEMAIVGGCNLCVSAGLTIQFARLGLLSHDGICKVFDKEANGYLRAECECLFLLQKRKHAKRIYCTVVHVKTNCDGYKSEGINFPSRDAQRELLTEFYQECKISPNQLSYLEAHGTGTRVGDPEECETIDRVFTKNRDRPLLIGSVKSCVGHSEPASGCISIVKSILALENGKIAPNLHFREPNPAIKGIIEGRLKVVTDVTKFEDDRALIGINNFGFGGANCHILIKGNNKQKINNGSPQDNLPRLVCFSGRTEESITVLRDYIVEIGIDAEFIGLLHNIFRKNIANHVYRGSIIISKDQILDSSVNDGSFTPWTIKPLHIVIGEFDDWYSVLRNFRDVGIFTHTLKRIEEILNSFDIGASLLSEKVEKRNPYDILGNVIVQLCMVDLLKKLNFTSEVTAGYPFGELVCAYSHEALSLEDTLRCAHIFNMEFSKKEELITTLRTVQDLNNGSLSIDDHVERVTKAFNQHKNNKDQRVLPNFFVEAVLKYNATTSQNSIKPNYTILEIGRNFFGIKGNDENVLRLTEFETFEKFLRTLGSLYQLGYNPPIEKLYPAISFPVSRSTPRLSSKIKWKHNRSHILGRFSSGTVHKKSVTIDLRKIDWSFISGHKIDGRILFPASGYLLLTWETFTENCKFHSQVAVTFENVRFIRASPIQSSDPLVLVVTISESGYFEVSESDSVVVTGLIKQIPDEPMEYYEFHEPAESEHLMTAKNIYKELRLRGYNYQEQFQAIEGCTIDGRTANILWTGNFITFIDNLFQLTILNYDSRSLFVPTKLKKLTFLPVMHHKFVKNCKNQNGTITVPAFYNPYSNIIKSGGIQVEGLSASSISRKRNLATPVLELYEFVPNETELPVSLSVRVNTQIIIENVSMSGTFASLEILNSTENMAPVLLTPTLTAAIDDLPLIKSDAKVFAAAPELLEDNNITFIDSENFRTEPKAYVLIIGTNLLDKKQVLDDALFALKDNGFIISRESKSFTKEQFRSFDLVLVTVHKTENEIIIMLRKSHKNESVFVNINNDPKFAWLPILQSSLGLQHDVVVYSENDPISGIIGFINCLRKEPEVKNVRAVLIMDQGKSFDAHKPTFCDQLNRNLALNIFKNGQWGTYRHLPINLNEEIGSQHVFLKQSIPGDLSSFKWMQGPSDDVEPKELPPEVKLVEIFYSSLNFKDIMIASGKITAESIAGYDRANFCDIGCEYAGIDQNGKRIMGVSDWGAIASRIMVTNELLWEVPDEWSMEDAVTVPVVYATMLYGLRMRGNIRRGESILIHSGVGGVGQAAIRYCLFHGLTVFTTVGSEERKEVLKKLFPELQDSHIGNSHNTSFEQMILKETKGKGVDLILNSLAEEKLLSSVRCLAKGGRMIEIGKYDIISDNMLNLALFTKEASFHGVMLDVYCSRSPLEINRLRKLMKEGIEEGSIRPLDRHLFKLNETEKAFRFMASGKHLGKVVIQIREEDKNVDLKQLYLQRSSAKSRIRCDPKKCYILIGGLGGFGLELADWLILRGAKKIVLSSSRGFSNGYQRMRVNVWRNYGAQVHVTTVDLSTKSGCTQLLKEAQALGPIDAIFNLAVCLKDALFKNQTMEMYEASLTPKAYVTKHLDELTRTICPDLRNFVVFSSVSCGKGNAGQTNYGMANSIMERICEARRRDGYPGKAIQWGAVGEVGILEEMTENNAEEINIGGTLLQKISSCLEVLDILLEHSSPIVSSIVVAEKTRGSYCTENVVEAVASIIGISDLKSVSLHSTLSELGIDSMTSVEVKRILERECDIFLSPKEIRTLTFHRLQEIQDSREDGLAFEKEQKLKKEKINIAAFGILINESESQILTLRMTSRANESEIAPNIIVIPGIEGFVKNLEPLCQKLKAHVWGLQYNYTEVPDTVQDIARMKLQLAEQYLSKSIPFHMIAYSYGVIEALELVSLLEAKGYYGTVYCIDGAPSVSSSFIENAFGKTRDEIETNSILSILMLCHPSIAPTEIRQITLDYQKCKNLDERFDKTMEVYGKTITISAGYARRLVKGIVNKVLTLSAYKPTFPILKSSLILFKPKEPTYIHCSEDFGLSEFCEKTIPVFTIEGNHTSIILNDDISKYINSKI